MWSWYRHWACLAISVAWNGKTATRCKWIMQWQWLYVLNDKMPHGGYRSVFSRIGWFFNIFGMIQRGEYSNIVDLLYDYTMLFFYISHPPLTRREEYHYLATTSNPAFILVPVSVLPQSLLSERDGWVTFSSQSPHPCLNLLYDRSKRWQHYDTYKYTCLFLRWYMLSTPLAPTTKIYRRRCFLHGGGEDSSSS